MFKKFTVEENVSSTSQIKNSVQRGIQNQILGQYPSLAASLDELMPKKLMMVSKCQDHVQLLSVNNEVLFFNERDGPWYPTLRFLHKYPGIMPKMQVDTGAIRFVLGGANVMCPGFTSPGGSLPDDVAVGQPVAIHAEGKEHAMAIGLTLMSTADVAAINKGVAVESKHFMNDGLWQLTRLL